ncbi:FK506-binding protein 15 isoform X1 [Camponotus floridanus]|uniref:FK506-binding protein 15 isoform X1 n=1 Tax=Camponotus floridanus TaxID=104421 RepID=UPI00059E8F4F|nr:FK506-binding protein 15 isoform X1 [Camponotus floridanus]
MSAQNQLPNLDKIFRDDDEADFVPSGGSNLAAIFGLQSKPADSTKQTAFKKNNTRYNIQQTVPSSKTEILIAKAVHAFKLQNGQYTSVGKLGIALTGNVTTRLYQIILYKTKQEYVSIATVTRDFLYTVQANNYASYYDNNNENWSILFESNESYLEFAIEMGLTRYFAIQEKGENVIYQDLIPANNKDITAKEGDNICIKYFVGTEIVQPFKINFVMSQMMTVEISTDDNWERVLLGSGKGLKRVLFLPPSKQISLGPGFPKEKDIMLIIEITDIRIPEENLPTLKTSTSGKASIISRMAKMGQPILPKMTLPSTTDSEDTEDDIPQRSPRHKKIEQLEGTLQKKNLLHESPEEKKATHKVVESRTEVPSVHSSTYKPIVAASPVTPQWTPPYFAGHYVTMDNQMYPVQQTVNRTVPAALDPGINMLLSETRITNAEIRMGMSKISDNVQKLLDKFHALELQNAITPTTSDKATLDASWKMFLALNASQAGVKENELSKSTDKNISNEKMLEAQNRISALENNLKKSEEEKESLLQINKDMNKKLQELETKLNNTNDELKKTKEALEEAKDTIKQCKEKNVSLENRLSNKEHIFQVDSTSFRQKDTKKKNREIKQIMNKTYHTLSERFADDSCSELSFDYVKSTIASTIKHITLQVLYEDSDEEDIESKLNKNVDSTIKAVSEQQTDKQIERISNVSSDNNLSIKRTETSKPTTIIPAFENEPPPVPLDSIDEVDSD